MSLIGGGLVTFVVENVANVTTAVSTADLSALHAHGDVRSEGESAFDGLVEGRPAATRVELGLALVERRLASCAKILAVLVELVVLTYVISMGLAQGGRVEAQKKA